MQPVRTKRRKPQRTVDTVIRLKAQQRNISHRALAVQFNGSYAASRETKMP